MNYDQWKLMSDRDDSSDLVTSCCGTYEEDMVCTKCGCDDYTMIEEYEYNERRREDAQEFNRDETH